VTLSACDTGSGEARAGEGVMGLRRGFIEAGAQRLLMTLWSISDEATVQIMSDFYEAVHQTGNAPQGLATVQRDWLVTLRQKVGLAKAVQLAGPFVNESSGQTVRTTHTAALLELALETIAFVRVSKRSRRGSSRIVKRAVRLNSFSTTAKACHDKRLIDRLQRLLSHRDSFSYRCLYRPFNKGPIRYARFHLQNSGRCLI
jgi:hypothetical protein